MAERLGAPGINKRLRPGYEPLTIAASLPEFSPQHITHKVFDFGQRSDGSTQWVTLFGSQYHGVDTMVQPTVQAWEELKERIGKDNLHRLRVFVEGRVRFPNIQLSDEAIFKSMGGETALFEALARRAGVTDIQAPEPSMDILKEFIDKYGVVLINDYVELRKYWEFTRQSEKERVDFATYNMRTMSLEYRQISHSLTYAVEGLGITGALRRLRKRCPWLPQLGDIPVDDRLLAMLMLDTLHVPIIQEVKPENRSDMQNFVLDMNYERDLAGFNAIMDAIKEGKDVVWTAGGPHLRAIIPPLMILQREYQRKRRREGLIYDMVTNQDRH